MEIQVLLALIARAYKEKYGTAPGKTKLIKLCYLAEVYYRRLTGERLTSLEWVFWKYGPYFWDFDKVISMETVFEKPEREDDFYPIEVQSDYVINKPTLIGKVALDRALEHGADDLSQILDFVYFDTEPMMYAKNRGELLDFSQVKPEEYYVVKKYRVGPKQGREIQKKIREWEMRKAKRA
ncbi:MAG: Panacea domain-containing protein [Candidatus Aminicenantales bacterium]